jgi:PhnB protein
MSKRSLGPKPEIEQLNQAVEILLAKPGSEPPAVPPRLLALLRVARALRDLPREDFKIRLQADLERMAALATTTASSAAVGVSVAPRLAFKDPARAIEFYRNAFGAREKMRFDTGSGIAHAEIMIGDSVIMLAEEWPEGGRLSAETLGRSPVTLALDVADVDAFAARAVAAGAKLASPIRDQFYGRREGVLLDPFGYTWGVSTRKEELSVEEMHRRFRALGEGQNKPAVDPVRPGFRTLTPYIVAPDAAGLIEFLKQAFGAEETQRTIGSAGGIHAEMRIDDSMLMIGGGGPGLSWTGVASPGAFHIYLPDCDRVYERALRSGATSIAKPADQAYGERSGSVRDAAGNHWYVATRHGASHKWPGAPTIQPYLHPLRAEPVIDFLQRAFGARAFERHASPDGVIHHVMGKIGNAYLEMGEAQGPYQPMASTFYLYVPDCDAVYRHALAAGALSLFEPADQVDGDRNGGVKDAFGNTWYIATHVKDVTS